MLPKKSPLFFLTHRPSSFLLEENSQSYFSQTQTSTFQPEKKRNHSGFVLPAAISGWLEGGGKELSLNRNMLCVCVCCEVCTRVRHIYVRVNVFVGVCVCERQRDRERQRETERERARDYACESVNMRHSESMRESD